MHACTRLWLATAALLVCSPTYADFSSTFDHDREGWRATRDVDALEQEPAGGSPGGYLRATEGPSEEDWFFVSPAAWAGDWRSLRSLRYDLQEFTGPDIAVIFAVDVQIIGANGDRLMSYWNALPGPGWTPYAFALDRLTFRASAERFDAVMADVRQLRIRGNYFANIATGLDNVRLSEQGLGLTGTAESFTASSVACVNRSTGQRIVAGRNVTAWDCDDAGLGVADGDVIAIILRGALEGDPPGLQGQVHGLQAYSATCQTMRSSNRYGNRRTAHFACAPADAVAGDPITIRLVGEAVR